MFNIILSLILITSFTNAVNCNYNNEFTIALSVYDYGIWTVKIDENQESDHNFNLIYNSSSDIKSIDFNYNVTTILWLENDAIKSAYFDFEHDTQINIDKINVIIESGAMAFSLDWIHGLIYYQNGKKKQIIAVNSTNPKMFIVIINETKENVGDIKLDPISGYLYWSQWDNYGNKAQIIRANQDGTNQTDISQIVNLKRPITLAIDFVRQKIYFIDNQLFIMGSIDKTGNYRIFTQDRDLTQYSRSSDIFRNHFYWNSAKSVYSNQINSNYFNQDYLRKPIRSQSHIDRIKILDSSRQPFANNRCYNNDCSYLCIPSGSYNYLCVCPQIDNMTSSTYCEDRINDLFDSSQTDSELNEYNEYYDEKLWSSYLVIIIPFIVFVIGTPIALIWYRRHISDSANAGQLEDNQNEEQKSTHNSSVHLTSFSDLTSCTSFSSKSLLINSKSTPSFSSIFINSKSTHNSSVEDSTSYTSHSL